MADPTPSLILRFKKISGGATALSATRADGTVTWQRKTAAHAAFFARHDLTHYAVETVLGHRLGFYGLLAAGWNFTDFGAPWPKGPIPANADPAELIVGFFDAERSGEGRQWTAAEFNEYSARFFGEGSPNPVKLTDEQISAIRERRNGLFKQWDAVKEGDSLELAFSTAADESLV